MIFQAGQILSHYRLLEKIGEGGMGVVWKAEDSKLGRHVAVKVLPPERVGDEERRLRFLREARTAAAVNHPNIAAIHEIGEEGETIFIAMELVEGTTLRARMADARLPTREILRFSVEMAEALASAHQAGIVHRDLKPDNVMVRPDGHIKILDFGLAKLRAVEEPSSGSTRMETISAEMTREGRIFGTAAYMSPEQARGRTVDFRSDQFSFGVVLYEMVTGISPFQNDNVTDTLSSLVRDQPRDAAEIAPEMPGELGRILHKCLDKDPGERFQNTADLTVDLRRLRRITDSAPTTRVTDSTLDEVKGPRTEIASDPSGAPARPLVTQRGPVVAATLGAAAVLALIAAAIVFWPRGAPEAPGSAPVAQAAKTAPSVAVLPFVNLSDDPANEYFSDGLAEELLNLLAKVRGLHVAARTSSFHFKGHTGNVANVASQLNVATILEGSVRRAGNRVRITAQLVNAADGFPLWSETYDRELDDVFAIQEDIATQVTDALKVTLLGEDVTRLAKRPTENMEAYDAYLLGQQRMARRRTDSLEESAGYFQRAIDLDPGFAAAHAYLANAYMLLSDYGSLNDEEAIARAQPLIERALELDGELGEAYTALGQLNGTKGDPRAAEAAYERAVSLNPNHALTYMWYALVVEGRDDDKAWRLLEKSLELDPMAPVANHNFAGWLLRDNKPREALERFRHITEIDPGYPGAYEGMSRIQLDYLEQPEEGLESLRKAVELDPGNLSRRLRLGWAYRDQGHTNVALATFHETIELDPGFAPAYWALAEAHWNAGRVVEAFRWGHQALDRDPTNFDYQLVVADACLHVGDEATAIEWYEAAKRSNPDNPFSQFLPDWDLHRYRGELDEFEELVQRALEVFPGVFENELIGLDVRAGRLTEARARVAEQSPELVDGADPQVQGGNLHEAVNVAEVLLLNGERVRAELLLRKSEEFLDSRDEAVVLDRWTFQPVEIYAWQGRIDEAFQALRRAMDHGYRFGWVDPLDPAMDPIKEDPRFDAMMAEMRQELDQARERLVAEGLGRP